MIEIVIHAEKLFSIGSLPVTNALLLSLVSFLFLAVVGIFFKRQIAIVPGKFQNVVEFGFEGLLNFVDSILHNRKKTEEYFPLVATIFFFILISNWLGLLPGVGSFVYKSSGSVIPLLRSPASDLNFTIALALIAVFSINILGILSIGLVKYGKKFINFSGPIEFFVGLLELVSEIAKIISFSFRLFGNVFAGEVLLTIIVFLIPYLIPLPFLMLEVFVGFIQAMVFTMLTVVFISVAIAEEHH
jgi:F-type H+-transporting ATPase subunit a